MILSFILIDIMNNICFFNINTNDNSIFIILLNDYIQITSFNNKWWILNQS